MNPGQKTFRPKPPDKGSFPLDHEGECKDSMVKYMSCLKKNGLEHIYCRDLAKEYLKCRMDRELMRKEDYSRLGFHQNKVQKTERQ